MATPTTPAGFGSGFNADKFREAIRATMTMGLPNSPSERATFRWTPVRTYDRESPSKNPYTWTATPTSSDTHEDVQIPVAVEMHSRVLPMDTAVGHFDPVKVVLTVLDTDYVLIQGADIVLLGGNTYDVDFVAPPEGLFEVTVYSIWATARDES